MSSRSLNWKRLGQNLQISRALASSPHPSRVEAEDANKGGGDFVEESDAGGQGTVSKADDVASHKDRVALAGAGDIGVQGEDAPDAST